MEQLRAAIQLREPPSLQIEYTPMLEIVLENHRLLENTQVFMNGQEMLFKRLGKERYRSTSLQIPKGANEVTVKIRVVDNQKIEVAKEFRFLIKLRSKPSTLSADQVQDMLKKHDFYDKNRNLTVKGFVNRFKSVILNGVNVIQDDATGLMWQQSGSPDRLTREKADAYVRECNRQKMAGFSDWRLPTLEEAMSLMEPKKLNGDLYIDPLFAKEQSIIWTADAVQGASRWWVVIFYSGYCYEGNNLYYSLYGDHEVRLVRSGHSISGK
jgi:hypothetical protein